MFFEFGIKDFIDILSVAFLLYYSYKLMKASGSINIFTGILVFILIWLVVSQVLEMKLLGSIFDKLVSVGVLALIVLFQEEIRRFLVTLGSHHHASALVRFFTGNKKDGMEHEDIMPIVMACISMGKQKVGALIVIERCIDCHRARHAAGRRGAYGRCDRCQHQPKELGLRHRAAMGISQVSDAHAIIVSEETGAISVAHKGQFYLRLNAEELERLLTKDN